MNDQPNQEQSNTTPPPVGEQVVLDGMPSSDSKTMGLLAHLLGILTGFLGPLIVWLVKKDTDPFVDDQGKEALNFQLSVLIAYVALGILSFIPFVGCITIPVMMAVGVANLVFCIMAAIKANEGTRYRYPVSIRFIK